MISPRRTLLSLPKNLSARSPWLALLAVGGAFGCYAAAQALWPDERPETPMATEAPVPSAPPRLRCETCGVVEAIRATEAADGRPAGWTFSVRLRDGSLRYSRGLLPGSWQVGDSMQLIGGERTWSLPEQADR